MILTRTPFRITLGGGGTDLPSFYREHGGYVLAVAIDKYMFVNVNTPILDDLIRVRYTKTEMVQSVEEVEHTLARAALERAMSFQQLTESFDQQIADQETQVEALKAALKKLELKLSEARGKADLLIAQHRRTRAVSRAADAQLTPNGGHRTFDRMQTKVAHAEALGRAKGEILGDDIDGRLHALDREQKIDALLEEIKAKKRLSA